MPEPFGNRPMTLVANFMSVDANPATWARDREAEGYDVVGVADHLWSSTRLFPHVWVSLGAMAVATTTAKLTTCFANNLFRNPVEFAQASFGMHALSGGRFEAGLGAGWTRAEMEKTGRVFPEPRDRAGMYIEALSIVRSLFDTGASEHHGEHYDVSVTGLRPASLASSPTLVGSVGGTRTVRECPPFLDVVEIKGSSASTRGGDLDFGVIGTFRSRILPRWPNGFERSTLTRRSACSASVLRSTTPARKPCAPQCPTTRTTAGSSAPTRQKWPTPSGAFRKLVSPERR
jgi:hypothetical protein